MKKLITAALAVLALAPLTARADHEERDNRDRDRRGGSARIERRAPVEAGRWERQVVQRWTEGRYEQRLVAESCVTRRRGHGGHRGHGRPVTRCQPAHYEQVWIAPQAVSTDEWVWVAAPSPVRFSANIRF